MEFTLVEAVIWAFIVVLSIIILILVFYLKILRSNIRITVRKNEKYRQTIESLLIEFLYAESEYGKYSRKQKKIIAKFKKGLISKRRRKIITDTFLQLDQQVSGQMIKQMNHLYKEIGLITFAMNKLRSRKWHVVAIGIKDLRQFKIRHVKGAISKLINHDREEVRREAQLYFLELFGYEGLDFLSELKVPLSDWDQVLFLGEVSNLENHQIEDVTRWLDSDNDYVIIFVLQIVQMFNRLETKNYLLKLLNHKNDVVRLKCLEVITHFEIVEAKQILLDKFENITLKEQIAFFEYLDKMATSEESFFLLNHVNDDNFEIKYKALQVLQKVNTEMYNKLEKKSEVDEEYNRIVEFLDVSYGV